MKRRRAKRVKPDLQELQEIIEQTRSATLSTMAHLTAELEANRLTIKRLNKMIFGARTEKTSEVLGDQSADDGSEPSQEQGEAQGGAAGEGGIPAPGENKQKKREGHGRNGASDYHGADAEALGRTHALPA